MPVAILVGLTVVAAMYIWALVATLARCWTERPGPRARPARTLPRARVVR